jgi:soluble lytic murein transglycosylase
MIFYIRSLVIFIIASICSLDVLAQDLEAAAFQAINSKKWDDAKQLAMQSGNKALINIVLSQKYLDSKCSTNDFASVIKFVKQNPGWPQIEKLKGTAEKYLNKKTDKNLILDWFSTNKPITGEGYKYYALAASSLVADKLKLIPIIKDGWIFGEFSLEEEKQYFSKFNKILTKDDHIKRIEEQLWKSDIEEARRLFYLIDAEHKKAFEVAILALQKHSKTEEAFKKLPTRQYIPVVLYHYLEYKKKTPPDDYLISLFEKVAASSSHRDKWCKLQLYYAREFIDVKDYARSYRVVSQHFANGEEFVREAEWLSGWLALQLHRPKVALEHFKEFANVVHKPISVAKGKYWIARTLEVLGQKEEAIKYYKSAVKYPYTFYGQMASIELGENTMFLPTKPQIDDSHKDAIEKSTLMRAVKMLTKFGKQELAHTYAKAAIDLAHSPGEVALIAEIIKKQGNTYYTVEFAKTASQKHILIKDAAYPTPYKFKNIAIEAPLAYGIIRQESVFNQYAVSEKDAMGLMQLIKSTAKITKDKCDVQRLTKDPEYNIRLGTTQLGQLLKERKGSYVLAIASYNTASRNVDKWINRFGDPREMKDFRKVIDWLELIPFSETRNYVQRVLEATQVYRLILNNDSKLKLVNDLMRKI